MGLKTTGNWKSYLTQEEYLSIHRWLKREYGKRLPCENKSCSSVGKVVCWALITGLKYEYKRDNFIRLCATCHKIYDAGGLSLSELEKINFDGVEESTAKIKRLCEIPGTAMAVIAERSGMTRATFSNKLYGRLNSRFTSVEVDRVINQFREEANNIMASLARFELENQNNDSRFADRKNLRR